MFTSRIRKAKRNQRGSMLVMACVVMTLLAVGLLIAASFAGVFFAHNRLQTAADEIALSGARKLNEFNRLGQMNDMVARSRQMVYGSYKQAEKVKEFGNNQLLEKLTDQLSDEARQSANVLEGERHRLTQVARQEAQQAMQEKFNEVAGSYVMTLPWLSMRAPRVLVNETGTITGMQSNSQQLQGFEELTNQEGSQVYKTKLVNLYRSETDARLPIDNSPSFRFSPLAAAVSSDMSPARAVLPEDFQRMTGDYAPCATKIELSLKVATGIGASTQADLKVASAASATGGGLWE